MKDIFKHLTTVTQNPEKAAQIIKEINREKPLSVEAQAHADTALALSNKARHLSNLVDSLQAAKVFFDATDEYESAHQAEPNESWIEQAKGRSAIEASAQIERELHLDEATDRKDYLDKKAERDPVKFAWFLQVFRNVPGVETVINNVRLLFEKPLVEEDEKKLKEYGPYRNKLQGERLQIDAAHVLTTEHVDGIEVIHSIKKQGKTHNYRVDLTTKNNIAIECKDEELSQDTVKNWVNQAANRLTPDSENGHTFNEAIVVIPDKADSQQAQDLFRQQLRKIEPVTFSRRIKLWTLSTLKKHKEEGYFDKK